MHHCKDIDFFSTIRNKSCRMVHVYQYVEDKKKNSSVCLLIFGWVLLGKKIKFENRVFFSVQLFVIMNRSNRMYYVANDCSFIFVVNEATDLILCFVSRMLLQFNDSTDYSTTKTAFFCKSTKSLIIVPPN